MRVHRHSCPYIPREKHARHTHTQQAHTRLQTAAEGRFSATNTENTEKMSISLTAHAFRAKIQIVCSEIGVIFLLVFDSWCTPAAHAAEKWLKQVPVVLVCLTRLHLHTAALPTRAISLDTPAT